MGITYFVIFIATAMAGILIYLLKNFSDSALLGSKDDLIELDDLQELYQKNEVENRKAEAYIHQYMVSLDQARCEKERRRNLNAA